MSIAVLDDGEALAQSIHTISTSLEVGACNYDTNTMVD